MNAPASSMLRREAVPAGFQAGLFYITFILFNNS